MLGFYLSDEDENTTMLVEYQVWGYEDRDTPLEYDLCK